MPSFRLLDKKDNGEKRVSVMIMRRLFINYCDNLNSQYKKSHFMSFIASLACFSFSIFCYPFISFFLWRFVFTFSHFLSVSHYHSMPLSECLFLGIFMIFPPASPQKCRELRVYTHPHCYPLFNKMLGHLCVKGVWMGL